ncbi:hypothetical protein G6F61_012914 [Rhizopus arrhizus]|nr:hypothetical protein G6F42_025541 [Rhizopus arrhizus]KAG1367435.1 hypothetical protein G6F61_012914 [Rhizopus arrhizus]
MPQAAFTPWWRLLHDSFGYAVKLHRWKIQSVESPVCRICSAAPEDDYHFVVGCPLKWQLWHDALSNLDYSFEHLTPEAVWSFMVTFHSPSGVPGTPHILRRLGFVNATLWKYHWRCVYANTPWSTAAAYLMFQQEYRLLLPRIRRTVTA